MQELKLPQKYKDVLNDFIEKLKSIYREGLVSVILYGSAASGEYSAKVSNINLLVILTDTSLENLSKASKFIMRSRFKDLEPLFFTEDYIRRSLDVFPIEFLDMRENYSVLYGNNILKNLKIDIKNLRFQCEQELKSKLINIKNSYLRNKNRYALRSLLFQSFTSIMHILRNLVRLKVKSPSYAKKDVLSDVAREFKFDTANLNKILEAKIKNSKLNYKDTQLLFSSLARDLEKIIDIVDHL